MRFATVRYSAGTVRYRMVHCGTVLYRTVLYDTVPSGDVWITKSNVITKLIRSFELSKNCSKIRVPGVMMRTGELN